MPPIEPRELDQIANDIYPMAELPDEWRTGDNGEPALSWVAAIHRSRDSRPRPSLAAIQTPAR